MVQIDVAGTAGFTGAEISESTKLMFTILFSIIMVLTIIFFFTLYFLWLDSLSGYTQGLRSAFLNFQPVLLDFPTAFYFSFSCYFALGFGDFFPYGQWFHLLVFLECLIALLNNGIIIILLLLTFCLKKTNKTS